MRPFNVQHFIILLILFAAPSFSCIYTFLINFLFLQIIDRDKWQLVKRFFLIDTITGRNKTYRPNAYVPENYFDKYSQIRYARRIELQFKLHENHYYFGNKITVPLLIIEYGYIEMHSYSPDFDIDFEFRVTFTKDFELSIFFHVSNPYILLSNKMMINNNNND